MFKDRVWGWLERANVVHMGDLMFNRRHAVVDRPSGASMKNWIAVLENIVKDHRNDTIYIFGHAGPMQPPGSGMYPVTGPRADVLYFRDYLTALLAYVQAEMKAGRTREEIVAVADTAAEVRDTRQPDGGDPRQRVRRPRRDVGGPAPCAPAPAPRRAHSLHRLVDDEDLG